LPAEFLTTALAVSKVSPAGEVDVLLAIPVWFSDCVGLLTENTAVILTGLPEFTESGLALTLIRLMATSGTLAAAPGVTAAFASLPVAPGVALDVFSNCEVVARTALGPNAWGTSLMGLPSRKLFALVLQSPSCMQLEHKADALKANAVITIKKAMQTRINVDFFISSPH
jgi:hypothetical protein